MDAPLVPAAPEGGTNRPGSPNVALDAYNFLGAWQLLPERGRYHSQDRPKSGLYRIEATGDRKTLRIHQTWVTLTDQALGFSFSVLADGDWHPAEHVAGQHVRVQFEGSNHLRLELAEGATPRTTVAHDILPNGFLQVATTRRDDTGAEQTDVDIYHRQLSVLPYSSSVSGAVVKPNESGVIRHKSLTAMEEQTNMQLQQIKQQIELLALQAQEIQRRKELSLLIYSAELRFEPVVGNTYHLYQKPDETHLLSMIGPNEWGRNAQPLTYLATVQLLADRTWKEL